MFVRTHRFYLGLLLLGWLALFWLASSTGWQLDHQLALSFFNPQQWPNSKGFIPAEQGWMGVLYVVTPFITRFTGFVLLALSLLMLVRYGLNKIPAANPWMSRKIGGLQRIHWPVVFLLLSVLLGPALLVNEVLKNQVLRPRPIETLSMPNASPDNSPPPLVAQPASLAAYGCDFNCSFPSGHVAGVAWWLSFAWVLRYPFRPRFSPQPNQPAVNTEHPKIRWITIRSYFCTPTFIRIAGLVAVVAMGYARMAQGGHFLSDVLAAWLIVETLNLLLVAIFSRFLDRSSSSVL